MRYQIWILSAFLVFNTTCSKSGPVNQSKTRISCQCIGVHDGDTITVLTKNKKQYKIRLAHIDCPEKGQPFGNRAREFTSDFCFGKVVNIAFEGKKDRNGRVIGEVFDSSDKNLNKELVKAGLAWHFKRYSNNEEYAALEIAARNQKIGLWSDPDSVAPWEWRANH